MCGGSWPRSSRTCAPCSRPTPGSAASWAAGTCTERSSPPWCWDPPSGPGRGRPLPGRVRTLVLSLSRIPFREILWGLLEGEGLPHLWRLDVQLEGGPRLGRLRPPSPSLKLPPSLQCVACTAPPLPPEGRTVGDPIRGMPQGLDLRLPVGLRDLHLDGCLFDGWCAGPCSEWYVDLSHCVPALRRLRLEQAEGPCPRRRRWWCLPLHEVPYPDGVLTAVQDAMVLQSISLRVHDSLYTTTPVPPPSPSGAGRPLRCPPSCGRARPGAG